MHLLVGQSLNFVEFLWIFRVPILVNVWGVASRPCDASTKLTTLCRLRWYAFMTWVQVTGPENLGREEIEESQPSKEIFENMVSSFQPVNLSARVRADQTFFMRWWG